MRNRSPRSLFNVLSSLALASFVVLTQISKAALPVLAWTALPFFFGQIFFLLGQAFFWERKQWDFKLTGLAVLAVLLGTVYSLITWQSVSLPLIGNNWTGVVSWLAITSFLFCLDGWLLMEQYQSRQNKIIVESGNEKERNKLALRLFYSLILLAVWGYSIFFFGELGSIMLLTLCIFEFFLWSVAHLTENNSAPSTIKTKTGLKDLD